MDVNYILQERKRQRLRKEQIHQQKLKRKFDTKKKYFDQDLENKLQTDILADKKKQFYDNLFNNNDQDIQQEDENIQEQNKQSKNVQQLSGKSKKTKKEKKMIKKVFTQRNSKGQPIMKNYLNVLVQKIEKDKKKK